MTSYSNTVSGYEVQFYVLGIQGRSDGEGGIGGWLTPPHLF